MEAVRPAAAASRDADPLRLPKNFESYEEGRQKGFLTMKALKETGKKVVGVYCSFVPTELIYASGAVPVGLCAFSEAPIPAAEKVLPRNLCPLIKASYGFALTDTCPYFYFSDLVVGETTCDGKRKMFELLNEIKETYVMQLPHSRDERALQAWRDEIIRLKEKLEASFGVSISEDQIRREIRRKNRERRAVLDFMETAKAVPAPVSGYEMSTVLDKGSFSFDLTARSAELEKRTADLRAQIEAAPAPAKNASSRPRIIMTGCPNTGVRDKIIKRCEELGGDIVAFDTCSGNREKIEQVDENEPDVYLALARKYLNINCSVMSPNTSRLDYLAKMMEEYQADGVLEMILTACHTYNVESHLVKRMVQEKGKAYLAIETDFSKADAGQIDTRLAAFLETITL